MVVGDDLDVDAVLQSEPGIGGRFDERRQRRNPLEIAAKVSQHDLRLTAIDGQERDYRSLARPQRAGLEACRDVSGDAGRDAVFSISAAGNDQQFPNPAARRRAFGHAVKKRALGFRHFFAERTSQHRAPTVPTMPLKPRAKHARITEGGANVHHAASPVCVPAAWPWVRVSSSADT